MSPTTNWRTTLIGGLVMLVLAIRQAGVVPPEYNGALDGAAQVFTAIGLIAAKDHNK